VKTLKLLSGRLMLMAAFSLLMLTPRLALAHAVLVASTPAAHATVKGPTITVHLKFNSRIDGKHSRLLLVDANGKEQTLTVGPQEAPDTLDVGAVPAAAGAYTLRWQALSADGHITRGEIPFTVQ
jgi:copper resistance protein C